MPPSRPRPDAGPALPRWPVAAIFFGYPLWWVLGIGDLAYPMLAAVMVVYLVRRRRVDVPRGFGIWLLFLLWMAFSVIGVDTSGRLLGFLFRASMYVAVTVLFLYVYNARATLTARYLAGLLTGFWLVVVAGGFIGILVPGFTFTTPMSFVIPDWLASNDLIRSMVYREVAQWNPNGYFQMDPRPSAPFLYTNGWGNAYSLLMPIVVAYLLEVRRERRFWWLLAAVPLSFVPAFLTLNRGMFIGLGLALAYVTVRLVLRGSFRALVAMLGLAVVIVIAMNVLSVGDRVTSRVETGSSTEDRASLYQETFERTLESPMFGYGAPKPSEQGLLSAGTQGQIWMLMFSHGFPGAFLFTAWLAVAYFRSIRERDPMGVACNTVLLVILVEILYYGVMTTGLAIAMMAAAMVMRPEPSLGEHAFESNGSTMRA
ncbi:MAG: hypothetical protein JWL94_1572 [Microbacteriaceae bacterium]|nr:hypothetical protein [Microbacteriaceae bacterium]